MANSGDADAKGKSVWDTNPVSPQSGDPFPRRSQNVGSESNNTKLSIPESFGKSTSGGTGNPIMQMQQEQQYPYPYPYPYPYQYQYPNVKTKDCLFFIHTGSCSFGANCRFNHPIPTKAQVEKQGNKIRRFPCKFFLAGFCKFGSYCKFAHSVPEIPPEPDEYNLVGYPIRRNQITCSYYMRTGICGFGEICKFDHPNEYLKNRRGYGSNVNGEVIEFQHETSKVTDGGHVKQISESAQPYYPLASLSNNCGQYQQPNYAPCNGYQVPTGYSMGMALPSESSAVTIKMADNLHKDLPAHKEKMSENTQGMTSFSAVPSMNAYLNEPLVLNEAGLPLRPGKTTCWFYENLGICKYGVSCAFHHPPKQSSDVHEGVLPKSGPSGENSKTKE